MDRFKIPYDAEMFLKGNGCEFKSQIIVVPNLPRGLRIWAAIDFLINYHTYSGWIRARG